MTLTCHLGLPGSSHCPSGSLSFLLYKVGAAGGRWGEWIHVHVWLSPFSAHLKLSHVNWLHPNTKQSFLSAFTQNCHVSWLYSNTHTHKMLLGALRFHRWAPLIWHAALSGHPASMCAFLTEGWEGASVTGPWTCNVHEGM